MEPSTSKTPKSEAAKTNSPPKTKKAAKVKAVKELAPKEPKPKKEKVPKEPMVVFAFRLSEAQRNAIHKAAGPGKATKFVRSAALAAAGGDRPAFEELLTQAKTNLK
jgi:hypothetical protein